mgnify:FL=1
MALSEIKAFGLRQVKLTDTGGNNPVILPAAMTFRFVENIKSEPFLASDVLVGQRSITESISWDLEHGAISLAAWAMMTGRTASAAGTTPNQTTTINADGAGAFPYFRVYGKSVGDAGDDIHCLLYRCKLTKIEGQFRSGEFWVSKCGGVAAMSTYNSNRFYQFVQHETEATL